SERRDEMLGEFEIAIAAHAQLGGELDAELARRDLGPHRQHVGAEIDRVALRIFAQDLAERRNAGGERAGALDGEREAEPAAGALEPAPEPGKADAAGHPGLAGIGDVAIALADEML